MILVWFMRAFKFVIESLAAPVSLVIPDGLEDDIVAFVLIGADAVAALNDLFISDAVLTLYLGLISFSVAIGGFILVEKIIRRFASLITGNDYTPEKEAVIIKQGAKK